MLKSLRLLQQSAAGALPPRPNPLRIGMIIPNFHITTTIGDLKFHTWLTSDLRRPWTVFVSHPTDFIFGGESDDDPRRKLITFASKMGCKFIGVSCDGNEVRHASSRDAMGNDDFPIILDPERCIMNYLGMLDIDVKDAAGFDVPARTFIILHGTTVRLSDMHQATVPRDFDEMLRVLSSFDLTSANHGLATPANWHTGDRVMVGPSVTTEEANANFLDLRIHALPSGKQYLRSVQCPPLPD
jgi:alkyl hydroperoxide reductase subunit AhpC